MTIAIDTDKAVQALTDVGFKKEQARVLIDQLLPVGDDLVTKDFLSSELALLRSEIARFEASLRSEIARLEALIENKISGIENKISGMETRMAARFYGGQIAAVVSVVGALKLFGVF